MHDVVVKLQSIAPTNATVLIQGDTGTGKELVAKAIHNNSPRKNKPFVAMNCTALNENLLDDELFGHEPGAFTGAERMRKGRFEYANGGTLFLDEVGDMPMSLQAKLLRVLENNEVFRIGSNEPLKVNVRVVSATHRDLESFENPVTTTSRKKGRYTFAGLTFFKRVQSASWQTCHHYCGTGPQSHDTIRLAGKCKGTKKFHRKHGGSGC
jgi:transcriptional regulator with AAA-type ATPase domain